MAAGKIDQTSKSDDGPSVRKIQTIPHTMEGNIVNYKGALPTSLDNSPNAAFQESSPYER